MTSNERVKKDLQKFCISDVSVQVLVLPSARGGTTTSVYSPGLESACSGEAALSESWRCRGDLRLGLNLQDVPGGLAEGLLTRV